MTEPVTPQQLKDHLRIYHTMQDDYLNRLITVAREDVEEDTWRAILPVTRTITRRSFPWGDEAMHLPRPPLVSVTSVHYLDQTGTSQPITDFRVDTLHEPGSIEPAYGTVWPFTQDGPAGVTVVYACGLTDPTTCPESLKQAILLIAAEMYEHSEPVEIKGRTTLDRLLEKWRFRELRTLEQVWQPKEVVPKFPGGFPLWGGANVW